MTAPRVDIDLAKVEHNARTLVEQLAPKGIRVTGVTKAALAAPSVANAMVRGGVVGLGDARIENLTRLKEGGFAVPITLVRSPMLSQVEMVVRTSDTSLNTEPAVLDALSAAAVAQRTRHAVILMVELGDLREGVSAEHLIHLAASVGRWPGLVLAGIGTNLACQSGIVPDQSKMDELSRLVEQVELACGHPLTIVSGGNSANLEWALTAEDVGRVDELRLGEAILLGVEPLHRRVLQGLHTDAFTLVGELIEVQHKPTQPWGALGQSAFGPPQPRAGTGTIRQGLVAVGRQDVDPDGLVPPDGTTIIGASSDHVVLDLGGHGSVGDELRFGLNYSALVRAMTSPFVAKTERPGPSGGMR